MMVAAHDPTVAWDMLTGEFDAWAGAGRSAGLWWRDDDAARPGPALDRLTAASAAAGAPLLLAVIPARVEDALADAIAGAAHVRVGQHGYAHVNHARGSPDRGAWELGLHRDAATVLAELDRGRARLAALFGRRFMAVIAPPWNRIDARLFGPIARAGFHGVSAFGPRLARRPAAGLVQVNAHADPIRWKGEPHFAGEARVINELVEHLAARRNGAVDADEATGLLSHHADLDAEGWAFVARLGEVVRDHPAACWRDPRDLFENTP